MKAVDIQPDKLYLLNNYHPVTIVCTEERGWKRGFVSIFRSNYDFFGRAISVDRKQSFPVRFHSNKDGFFTNEVGEISKKFIDKQKEKAASLKSSLQKQLEQVSSRINELEAVN